jgi:hypothetical protein
MSDQANNYIPRTALGRSFPTLAKMFGGAAADRARKRQQKLAKPAKPHLPIVNLLPPRLAADKARRNLRRAFMLTGLIMVAGSGLVWIGQAATNSLAGQTLTDAKAQVQTAIQNLGKLGSTVDFFDALDKRANIQSTLMRGQIDQNKVISLVQSGLPAGSDLSQLTITLITDGFLAGTSDADKKKAGANDNPAALCGIVSEPFSKGAAPLGCLKFTGTVSNRTALATLGSTLTASELLGNVAVAQTGSDATTGLISFSATASVNPAAAYITAGAADTTTTTATGGN